MLFLVSLDRLGSTTREKILECLGKIHLAGFHLPNFAERNVVHRDGSYRLIDFHDITKHKCRWDGEWKFGQREPVETFNCEVLREQAWQFDVWKYRTLPVSSRWFWSA